MDEFRDWLTDGRFALICAVLAAVGLLAAGVPG
jgi:hypothetical protein